MLHDERGAVSSDALRNMALQGLRYVAQRKRVRGIHRLAEALYDPFTRADDFVDGIFDYRGGLIHLDTRSYIEWWIYIYGSFEGAAVDLLAGLVDADGVVFDVGANIGVYSLPLSRSCGEVHAFEPHPTVRDRLAANLRLNRLDNVRVAPQALSDHLGETTLFGATHANQGQASLRSRDDLDASISCSTNTIDNYVQIAGLQRVDLIKIDVEGGELDVLRGAVDVLADLRPHLYIEVNPLHLARFGASPEDVFRFLASNGYQAWSNTLVETSTQLRRRAAHLYRVKGSATMSPKDHYWLCIPDERGRLAAAQISADPTTA